MLWKVENAQRHLVIPAMPRCAVERRSFSVQTRLNVAFSPTLTLQLFAQPLVSSGNYLTYKQLRQSESFDFDVLGEGQAASVEDGVACSDGRTCVSEGTRYVDFDGDGSTDLSFSDRRVRAGWP